MLDTSGKQQLINYLIDNIERGIFRHGSKVKSTQKLAKEFKIALTTAHSALQQLEKEGYIVRTRGKGTFISSEQTSSKPLEAHHICIIMPNNTFREQMANLTFELNGKGVGIDVIDKTSDTEDISERNFSKYHVIVVTDYKIAKILSEKRPELHIICIGDTHSYSFKGDVVCYNYYTASYQAVRHLISLGYKKIALYNMDNIRDRCGLLAMNAKNIEEGYLDAMQDSNIDYRKICNFKTNHRNTELLRDLLKGKGRPEAVVCTFDHRAMELYNFANAIDLSIPKDLALMSLGSSSIAKEYKISSFDFCPEAIAPVCKKMILDILEKKRYKRMSQHVILDTELIIRDSCGYKLKHGEADKHFD